MILTFFLRLLATILGCTSMAASLFGLVFIIPMLYVIWFTDCLNMRDD